MSTEKIPTRPQMGRSLIEHDPKSRAFPARGVLMQPTVERRNKTWRRPTAYDQGQTSSCVGQTLKGVISTSPLTSLIPYSKRRSLTALEIYHGAQVNDDWPGEEPTYYGTSALGACKYLQGLSLIKEYRWCFGADDVIDTLVQHGPVAIGIWWYDGMWKTDDKGFLHPTGKKVGGHEVELHGVNVDKKYVIGTNSWGTDWGANGRFYISWDDLDTILEDDGDAVTIVSC